MIPQDPVILLSFVNTKLRDSHMNLIEWCKELCIEPETICKVLSVIDYRYCNQQNQFI